MIQLNDANVKKVKSGGWNFFFSFFSCIFALRDIRFGEYGHISAFDLHIRVFTLIPLLK